MMDIDDTPFWGYLDQIPRWNVYFYTLVDTSFTICVDDLSEQHEGEREYKYGEESELNQRQEVNTQFALGHFLRDDFV